METPPVTYASPSRQGRQQPGTPSRESPKKTSLTQGTSAQTQAQPSTSTRQDPFVTTRETAARILDEALGGQDLVITPRPARADEVNILGKPLKRRPEAVEERKEQKRRKREKDLAEQREMERQLYAEANRPPSPKVGTAQEEADTVEPGGRPTDQIFTALRARENRIRNLEFANLHLLTQPTDQSATKLQSQDYDKEEEVK